MAENRVALKMVIDGKEREVTYEELALSNNLAQEALVRLLIEKGIFEPKEMLGMLEKVKKRTVPQPRPEVAWPISRKIYPGERRRTRLFRTDRSWNGKVTRPHAGR